MAQVSVLTTSSKHNRVTVLRKHCWDLESDDESEDHRKDSSMIASLITEPVASVPRKRQRLSGLSPSEKLLRRKMKNREAAQTARDRKKARMDSLEAAILQLEKQNRSLQSDNKALTDEVKLLRGQNTTLKKRLGVDGVISEGTDESVESAAFTMLPLQQEQARAISHWMAFSVTVLFLIVLNEISYPSLLTNFHLKRMMKLNRTPKLRTNILNPILKWWGAHQKMWTPSMNS